jgi:heme exporter protein B
MNDLYRESKTIFLKDVKTELRSRAFLGTTFMFAVLVIIIFNFAFEMTSENTPKLASGILWIAFLFSGTLGLGRSFQVERENDCINGLTLSPVDRMSIFWGKTAGNILFLVAIQIVVIPMFIVLYNINVMERFLPMVTVIFLADLGFMSVGTLISAMSANLKARELLLPVLLLPILVPLLIFAAGATNALIDSGDMSIYYSRTKLIAAFDVIFFVVSSIVFEYIVDES